MTTRVVRTILIYQAWSIPAIIGTAVIYSFEPTTSNRVGLLIAFYCTQFFLAEGNLIFSLISRNVAGRMLLVNHLLFPSLTQRQRPKSPQP